MKTRMHKIGILFLSLFIMGITNPALSAQIDDSEALRGIKTTKTIFDINLSDAKKLELYLGVIRTTRDDLVRQGQHPDIVITFRGASVRLISSENWAFTEEDQQSLERSALILKELKESGTQLEACSVATNLFQVDNNTILPGIKVVGNTFVSLTGYQAKGYSLIPIQ